MRASRAVVQLIVFDWVRQLCAEIADYAGGLLVPFGSSCVNVGDRQSDIDVVVIVSDEVSVDDFIGDGSGQADGTSARLWWLWCAEAPLCCRLFAGVHAVLQARGDTPGA